eukprot:Tbor_TRINITY_DN5555_c4_g1::TRINITY_DN5555_c4_g1_i1::g.13292::m.13292/K01620/ltaE; threonine aldolase
MDARKVIDLRSDTLTSPNSEMRKCIAEAEVGDDVFQEDITTIRLEENLAKLCGKEKALFVPTGTMGNLICAIIHGQGLFSEIIMGSDSHTANWEVGGVSILGRVFVRQVQNAKDGSLPIESLAAAIQGKDIHTAITRCIFLENTQNAHGGKVLSLDYVASVRKLCDDNKIKLHCDGARLWNAAVALNCTMAQCLEHFDTASICLSKALGAPVGSIIVGSADFISDARKLRKMLGGGMRQVGVLAAAAQYALDHMYGRLKEDHMNAKILANGLKTKFPNQLEVVDPDSNIVIFFIKVSSDLEAAGSKFAGKLIEKGVKVVQWKWPGSIRAIPHYGNTAEDMEEVLRRVGEVFDENTFNF